ncbi:MAG: type II toxin-antitoxin system VapC family toxin [Cyanobacteria bacterium J06634_5]
MPANYLLDTNIFILLFDNRLIEKIPDGNLTYSIITEIELLSFAGLHQTDEKLIRHHLHQLQAIALDQTVCDKAIWLRRQYRLKTPDAIIVASAWKMNACLLTNDQKLLSIKQVEGRSLDER